MITSSTNQHIKWVRTLQSKRSARYTEGMYVIEGTRLMEEALKASQRARLVLHTQEWASKYPRQLDQLNQPGTQVELVGESALASCSDVETPQGVLAVLPIPKPNSKLDVSLTLILDRLADPGNLGSLLRTALAAQVDQVYLTPGSVDAYNPKVVRSAMGAHFNLAVEEATVDQIVAGTERRPIWIAEARQGKPYTLVDWRAPVALAIGSEAHGIDPALEARAFGKAHIPIASSSESLNAATAAAIILFEIRRQREG